MAGTNNVATRKPSAAQRLAELEAELEATKVKLAEAEAAKAAATKATQESGYKAYATKAISPAVKQYAVWLVREFPELYPAGAEDAATLRLIQVSLKGYTFWQKSDLSLKNTKAEATENNKKAA